MEKNVVTIHCERGITCYPTAAKVCCWIGENCEKPGTGTSPDKNVTMTKSKDYSGSKLLSGSGFEQQFIVVLWPIVFGQKMGGKIFLDRSNDIRNPISLV